MLISSLNLPVNQLLAALAVLVLPGAVWLAWTRRGSPFSVWLADAVGLSVSFYALAWLLSYFFKFNFSLYTLRWIVVFQLTLLIFGWVYQLIRYKFHWNLKYVLLALGTLVFLAAAVTWRLFQAKTLIFPAWVDSVHHALIIRVFQEQGHLVGTLKPYLNVPFAYHYSFHALTSMVATFTGLNAGDSMLWFGQVLNALIGLSVYRLGLALWGDWRRSLLAALAVTFALHLPAYYLTWGRYTLTIGMVMLPLAMAALIENLRAPSLARWVELLVLTAGLALSHLTALLLFGIFALTSLLTQAFRKPPADETADAPRWRKWIPIAAASLAMLNGLAVVSPWLYRMWGVNAPQAEISAVAFADPGQVNYWLYIWQLLGPDSSYFWLALAAIGLVWAFIRRDSWPLALWALVIALIMNPWGIRLNPFRPDHMAIILFLPVSLFAADLLVRLLDHAPVMRKPALIWAARIVLVAVTAAGLLRGTWDNRDVINPATVLADEKDRAVLDWVSQNTYANSKFLINTSFWLGSSYRGVDGGYWLEPYTGRRTVLPPVFYVFDLQEAEQINRWAKSLTPADASNTALEQVLDESQPDYLYIRLGKGSLQPTDLDGSPRLLSIYRQHDVVIYQVLPKP